MAKKRKKAIVDEAPSLFPRGAKEILYFRMHQNGRDRWISTRTSDEDEAEKVRDAVLDAENHGRQLARDERSSAKLAKKVANVIVEGITETPTRQTPITEGLNYWISVTPEYDEQSSKAKDYTNTIYSQFAAWCDEQEIRHLEDVSPEVARRYTKTLTGKKISPRTFNGHVSCLSRIFDTIDSLEGLPYRNPFNKRNIPRRKKTGAGTVSKEALEPEDLKKVISEAADDGEDFRDLIIIGANTGLRLKDAVLIRWERIDGDFIELLPHKTASSGRTARIPINETLSTLLAGRRKKHAESPYILRDLANHYLRNDYYVQQKVQSIFDRALGEDRTRVNAGRKRQVCVCGFHSLRVTFMSLLAAGNVTTRDAMRMMAWESPEMVRHYERELRKARGDADDRARKAMAEIDALKLEIPECPRILVPTEDALWKLVEKYSNVTIGQIYGVSEAAIRKQLRKHGIRRQKRVESGELNEEDLEKIRKELLG